MSAEASARMCGRASVCAIASVGPSHAEPTSDAGRITASAIGNVRPRSSNGPARGPQHERDAEGQRESARSPRDPHVPARISLGQAVRQQPGTSPPTACASGPTHMYAKPARPMLMPWTAHQVGDVERTSAHRRDRVQRRRADDQHERSLAEQVAQHVPGGVARARASTPSSAPRTGSRTVSQTSSESSAPGMPSTKNA